MGINVLSLKIQSANSVDANSMPQEILLWSPESFAGKPERDEVVDSLVKSRHINLSTSNMQDGSWKKHPLNALFFRDNIVIEKRIGSLGHVMLLRAFWIADSSERYVDSHKSIVTPSRHLRNSRGWFSPNSVVQDVIVA